MTLTPQRRVAMLAFLAVLGTGASAQVFKVQGGASTLFDAQGASVDVKSDRYEGQIGAGMLNGNFQVGANFRTRFLDGTLILGDESIRLDLPTDVFDHSHYFMARGVGFERVSEKGRTFVFGGTTTEGYFTPFFSAARSDQKLSVAYWERKLSQNLEFVSRNLVSDQQTSIQALRWSPRTWLKVSFAGGIGSNQPFAATGLELDRRNFTLRAEYVAAGSKFQRIQLRTPQSSEMEKENVAFSWQPFRFVSLNGSHENILQPPFRDQPLTRAVVDEFSTRVSVAKFYLGGGIYNSRIGARSTLGENLYLTRELNRRLSFTGNYFRSVPDVGAPSSTWSGSVREVLTQRLAITQTVVRAAGQTSTGLGGEFTGNLLSAQVGYQTVYTPLRLDRPFQQVLNFNLRLNLPHNLQLTAGSFVDPLGRVRYTFGISTYLYRHQRGAAPGGLAFRFPRYVVAGVVVDPGNNPIEGAAIHINGQVAYSDQDGRFALRTNKTGPFRLEIVPEEFIASGVYETVQAPATVTASAEDRATVVRIVLRRTPVAAAAGSR